MPNIECNYKLAAIGLQSTVTVLVTARLSWPVVTTFNPIRIV